MSQRLTKKLALIDEKSLTDVLMTVAANIEDALLQHGATPGKDYTYIDLYNMSLKYIGPSGMSENLEIIIG